MALIAPWLPSLGPKSASAQAPTRPVRYIQVVNPYGPATRHFYKALGHSEKQEVERYVAVRRLGEDNGDISPMLGSSFTPLKDKITLIHGMDINSRNPNHNFCFPTCASGYQAGLDGDTNPPASGQPSVDVIISQSSKVYGTDIAGARRLMVLNPVETDSYSGQRSFSWTTNGSGAIEMLRPTKSTLGLQDLLASGFESATTSTSAPDANLNEEALMNAVYDDYRRTRDNTRLGADDRRRLDAYMALVQDAIRPAASGTTAACKSPQLAEETDISAKVTNQIRLMTAAMLCDITRVASITLGTAEGYDVRHVQHHDEINTRDDVGLVYDFETFGRWVGQLVAEFDAVADGEGTLLDNSLIYWSSQYGNLVTGDAHRSTNMPVMVAGSAGGQLQTGYYIDYRKEGHLSDDVARGIPINNLMVTFMNCMGLSSSDYEVAGKAGYGDYVDGFFDNPMRGDPARWSSTEGRRSALPFFYRGAVRG